MCHTVQTFHTLQYSDVLLLYTLQLRCTVLQGLYSALYSSPTGLYRLVQCAGLYNVRGCTIRTGLYNVQVYTMYRVVQCTGLYNVQTCTKCTDLYSVQACTVYRLSPLLPIRHSTLHPVKFTNSTGLYRPY